MRIRKNIVSLIIALTSGAFLHAQYLPRQGEGLHISYGYLAMFNTPKEMQKMYSDTWQIELMNEFLLKARSHFSLGYGVGISTFNWRTNLSITSSPGTGQLNYGYLPADSVYDVNRFSSTFMDVPVEVRFRSNTNKHGRYWRFYIGGQLGYRLNSASLFRTGDYSVKHYRINDLATWHYGFFVRTGYWLFNVYAYYGINPVFKNTAYGWENIKDMRSLTLGLSISL